MSVNEKMKAIADAIRAHTGGTDALTLDAMAEAIAGIETGGGGIVFVKGTVTPSETHTGQNSMSFDFSDSFSAPPSLFILFRESDETINSSSQNYASVWALVQINKSYTEKERAVLFAMWKSFISAIIQE